MSAAALEASPIAGAPPPATPLLRLAKRTRVKTLCHSRFSFMVEDPEGPGGAHDAPASSKVEDPFDLCGSTIQDKYRVVSVVGAGGFGVVYRGVHTGFGEPIAIKCLKLSTELDEASREKLLTRLQDEGRVLHRLSKQSSGIVQALDVGAVTTPRGPWVPYLVLEWLDGESLAEFIATRRRAGPAAMSLVEAMSLLAPAASALAVAHRQKVAHRDVKPDNLYLTEVSGQRTMKVLDFGIAKVLTQHATFTAAAAATQQAASAFTPSYGAPEQFNKKRGATGPWTDVFALVLILVELVSGERALDGDDATQLYIASADPASRPTLRYHGVDTSEEVELVLQQALAVDPSERFQDAGSFWSALEAAVGASEMSDPTPPPDVSETGEFVSRLDIELASGPLSANAKSPGSGRHAPAAKEEADNETGSPPGEAQPHPAKSPTTKRSKDPEPTAPRSPGAKRRSTPPEAEAELSTAPSATIGDDDPEPSSGSRWIPLVVLLALAGAGLLYWQLRAIVPTPVDADLRSPTPPQTTSSPIPETSGSTLVVTAPVPTKTRQKPPTSSATTDTEPDAATVDGGLDGSVDASPPDAEAPVQVALPAGMVFIPNKSGDANGDAGPAAPSGFFIDRTEVSASSYRDCVMAGNCKKATRIVLTEETAKALGGVPNIDATTTPEQLAAAWGKRCNEVRNALDHPINCVNFPSAEDYCSSKKKRLPTSAEWTLAATGDSSNKYSWGQQAPECSFSCYGLNGSCVTSAKEVASCAIGSRKRDRTGLGLVDMAGNVAEWVSDKSNKRAPHGPTWRLVRGGSFIDEAGGILNTTSRSVPPVTAYVSVGFRCAKDAPAGYHPPPASKGDSKP